MKKIIIVNSKGGAGKSTLALSVADTLKYAQLVDLDSQGTLTTSASFTGRHTPIEARQEKGHYLIYDTPPCNSTSHADLFKVAGHILIPIKVSVPDLLASTAIINQHSLQKSTHL